MCWFLALLVSGGEIITRQTQFCILLAARAGKKFGKITLLPLSQCDFGRRNWWVLSLLKQLPIKLDSCKNSLFLSECMFFFLLWDYEVIEASLVSVKINQIMWAVRWSPHHWWDFLIKDIYLAQLRRSLFLYLEDDGNCTEEIGTTGTDVSNMHPRIKMAHSPHQPQNTNNNTNLWITPN